MTINIWLALDQKISEHQKIYGYRSGVQGPHFSQKKREMGHPHPPPHTRLNFQSNQDAIVPDKTSIARAGSSSRHLSPPCRAT
jgi:hypothetical protein